MLFHIKRIALNNFLKWNVKRQMLFDPDLSGEFICVSVMQGNYSNSFRVSVSFATFLTLRKVGADLFAALILCGFYPDSFGILIKKKVNDKLFLKCTFFCYFSGVYPVANRGSEKNN